MFKIFGWLLISALALNADDMLTFYQTALRTLQIDRQYQLELTRGKQQVSGADTDRFSSLSFDLRYTRTKADTLKDGFNVTDLSVDDTLDLFGKQRDAVTALKLQSEGSLEQIQIQKRTLYGALTDMITLYRKNEMLLELHTHFFDAQSKVYASLQKGVTLGSFARMDAQRFSNALALLQNQIMKERQTLQTMQTQLALYAPGSNIPDPDSNATDFNKTAFMTFDPALRYARTYANISHVQADGVAKQWRPDAVAGAAYQFNSDPTAYGDNYSVYGALRLTFGGGIGKRSEAARAAALKADSAIAGARIAAEREFQTLRIAFDNARDRFKQLTPAVRSAQQNAETIKEAYFRHYVDFNTYLQTMQQLLTLQEQRIAARFEQRTASVKLNAYCQGKIYE